MLAIFQYLTVPFNILFFHQQYPPQMLFRDYYHESGATIVVNITIMVDNTFMKRDFYQNLLAWKAEKPRKPLILQGARQVGKTIFLSILVPRNIGN